MKKFDFSKIVVTLIILLNIMFTITIITVFLKTGSEPPALVAAWFAFTTSEIYVLAKIKRDKIKKGEDKNEG